MQTLRRKLTRLGRAVGRFLAMLVPAGVPEKEVAYVVVRRQYIAADLTWIHVCAITATREDAQRYIERLITKGGKREEYNIELRAVFHGIMETSTIHGRPSATEDEAERQIALNKEREPTT